MTIFRVFFLLATIAFSVVFANQKVCSILGQAKPLLFSDPQLLDHLLLRTRAIISFPRCNNDIKMAEICQLAERNFDGLKSLAADEV